MTKLSMRQKLEKFHETVQELKSTSLMKKGLSSNMKIKIEGPDVRYETKWPKEDDLRSFLLTFRQFVADKEDVFMNHILNLCHQRLTDDKLREYLAGARQEWKKEHDTVGLDIVYQGKRQTPEQVTQLWLSGTYFHKDEDKRSVLKELPYPQRMLFKHQFLSYLVGATRIIFYVDRIVEKSLNEGLLRDWAHCLQTRLCTRPIFQERRRRGRFIMADIYRALYGKGHRRPGRPRSPRPDAAKLAQLYGTGASIRACALALGVSRDVIHAALKEAGIIRRPRVHAARLPNMDQERLFALIAYKGITKAATALGISRQTLHKYLAELRHKSEK